MRVRTLLKSGVRTPFLLSVFPGLGILKVPAGEIGSGGRWFQGGNPANSHPINSLLPASTHPSGTQAKKQESKPAGHATSEYPYGHL